MPVFGAHCISVGEGGVMLMFVTNGGGPYVRRESRSYGEEKLIQMRGNRGMLATVREDEVKAMELYPFKVSHTKKGAFRIDFSHDATDRKEVLYLVADRDHTNMYYVADGSASEWWEWICCTKIHSGEVFLVMDTHAAESAYRAYRFEGGRVLPLSFTDEAVKAAAQGMLGSYHLFFSNNGELVTQQTHFFDSGCAGFEGAISEYVNGNEFDYEYPLTLTARYVLRAGIAVKRPADPKRAAQYFGWLAEAGEELLREQGLYESLLCFVKEGLGSGNPKEAIPYCLRSGRSDLWVDAALEWVDAGKLPFAVLCGVLESHGYALPRERCVNYLG